MTIPEIPNKALRKLTAKAAPPELPISIKPPKPTKKPSRGRAGPKKK